MNSDLFETFESLTFDDVLIVPGYSFSLVFQSITNGSFSPPGCETTNALFFRQ